MNKQMKKANERLASAQAFVKEVAKNVKVYDPVVNSPVVKATPVKPVATKPEVKYVNHDVKYFSRFEIKKKGKGDFRVQADGLIVERRFKSMTAAMEWIGKHTKS